MNDIKILLVTCCVEETRYEILKTVVQNVHEQFSWCKNSIDVFDNGSTVAGTRDLLQQFENVYFCSKNIGYWSAINWWLKNIRAKYTYIIESDMIHRNAEFIKECCVFLDANDDVGSIRTHEYSIQNSHLYNKDKPRPDSIRTIWQSHTNRVTGKAVKIFENNGLIATTSFLTQLPAINRYDTMVSCFSQLANSQEFTEFDFQRLYWQKYVKTGIVDGGLFYCDPRSYMSDGVTGSWSSEKKLNSIGYKQTRKDCIVHENFFVSEKKRQLLLQCLYENFDNRRYGVSWKEVDRKIPAGK